MPNPWDEGSARLLTQLGFRALATTSAGFAWTKGRPDNGVSLDAALVHLQLIANATPLPVSADFEAGFAVEPEGVATNVGLAAATGIAGLSIEDGTGDAAAPLFDFTLAVERIRAARRALDRHGAGLVLTGRSEGFRVGRPDLAETIRRLIAYADAGADCVFAPGVQQPPDIAAIVAAVAPRPVNALVGGDVTTVADLAALGVRRISVGGGLARVAGTAALEAAREIAERGTFSGLGRARPFAEFNRLFE